MVKKKEYTIPQLAEILGVSRIAIYNRVKKGQIPARKVGRNYIISDSDIADILGKEISPRQKQQIDKAVRKTVAEYGRVLKDLAKE